MNVFNFTQRDYIRAFWNISQLAHLVPNSRYEVLKEQYRDLKQLAKYYQKNIETEGQWKHSRSEDFETWYYKVQPPEYRNESTLYEAFVHPYTKIGMPGFKIWNEKEIQEKKEYREGLRKECPICFKTFKGISGVKKHVRKKHPNYELLVETY